MVDELLRLDNGRQFGAENAIPEPAGDAKAKLIVKEVVLKVVLLQFLVPERQVLVVKEVVRQVVADVTKDASAINSGSGVPAVRKNPMSQLVERRGENYKKCRRHDEAILVHRQVMMDAVEEEMHGNANSVVRKPPGFRYWLSGIA